MARSIATPVLDAINRTADDPSVSVSLPIPLAGTLIEMAGGEYAAPGTWQFPDGFWTWATDEALRYALEVMPTVCE
jgi:hypothetical protein